jgi:Family of unknown function (DUF6502)
MPTKITSTSKQGAEPTIRRAREAETIARALQDLLELIAPILFAHGITPAAVAGLAKNALVASAAGSSRMSTGRVNQSKVAAVTGLSRAEVRRRLVESPRLLPPTSRALDRSARVVAGWLRDPLFLDRNGKPKTLQVRSGAASFAELVRLHSGDIPPRVVLEQLKERGMVRVTANGVSLKSKPKQIGGTPPATLLDVLPYIRELLAVAAAGNARLAYAQRIDVFAEGNSQAILLTERVVRALATTAAALSSLPTLGEDFKSPAERTKLTIALTVTSKSLPGVQGKARKTKSN